MTEHFAGWHREDIKAAIRKKGQTLSGLARLNELDESTVRQALIRPLKSGEIIISNFLDIPLYILWPERWCENGQRKTSLYMRKHNTTNVG